MTGKHVVVTGGNGGLGRTVVARLRESGAEVHVLDMPQVDATDEAQIAAYYAALPSCWASIQLIGGFAMAKVADTTLADFEKQWRLNTATCFLSCREAVRAMRRAGGGGRIVNVAARPVLQPTPGMIAYATAKAGVAAITQQLATEVLAENILVNAVLPSIIDTPANRASMPKADHASWPKTAELAEAIAFLASEENTLTTGTLVPVYGRA
jgi:NAD(P)-dependent dehydrogenase (short-subunit alcohol dehydrogenase family)